jgi:NAD(P)-dependent dehydrogenase (short-subunit alcohol dehydrogenase family)
VSTGPAAVVVGGTHGMGVATAHALIDRGAAVVVTGRPGPNLERAAAELGPAAHVVAADVTHADDIEALGRLVEHRHGQVDAVFLNAGYAHLDAFADVSPEVYDRTFAVNARGAFFVLQRLAPLVRDGGAIVVTTSIAAVTGTPGMIAYSGAKAALRAFVRVLAAELLPRHVRVNAVSPGFVRTPTLGVDAGDADRARFAQEGADVTPLGRIGLPEEVAAAALFLAFDATFTTGAELPVDGGLAQQLEQPEPRR